MIAPIGVCFVAGWIALRLRLYENASFLPFHVTIDFERESLRLDDPSIAEPDETGAAPPP